MYETLLSWKDLDERSEIHDALHRAVVDPTDLGLFDESADYLLRLFRPGAVFAVYDDRTRPSRTTFDRGGPPAEGELSLYHQNRQRDIGVQWLFFDGDCLRIDAFAA